LIVATVLGLATVSDAFIFLSLQRRLDVGIAYFPLLPLGSALVYLVLAVPCGRLADRFGRRRMFLGGYVCLVGVYALLVSEQSGLRLLLGTLVLHGAYYAATNGVLMSIVSPLLPRELRTSGIALVQTSVAMAGLVSSITFGAIWSWRGPSTATTAFLVALVVALAIAVVARPRHSLVAAS
jgi:MFS family permease